MKFIFQIKKPQELHHFYLVKSDSYDFPEIKLHLSRICDGESDFTEFIYDAISVDDARALIDLANRKIATGKNNFIFVKANSINHQAQNSLLKSLEEATQGLHFFFIIPELNNILPTVISRSLVIDNQSEAGEIIDSNFLKLDIAKQIKFVENLVGEIKDGEKTKRDAENFADSIIRILEADSDFKKDNPDKLQQILEARDFISDNGSSVKSLLEFIVLALPRK